MEKVDLKTLSDLELIEEIKARYEELAKRLEELTKLANSE